MAIFRGTGGSGSSSDSTIVDAVTAQAGIATTKADEAEGFRDEAEGFKNTASTAATTATTKATEANDSADTASDKATEANTAKGLAEDAQTAAEAARDAALGHSNTANSSAVQTVAGSNTQVVGVYNNIANVNTVAGVNTDVTTVAGISSDVTTVAADASDIGTVSTNIANVNNVGNNIANVNAVHGNASNINTVAADGTDIGTVATNIANVNTVAGISSTVTTVAGLESKMDTVIADASDIGAVAGNIGDVTTVAGINSDVDTVAGIAAKVTTVADNISDVQNADTNATNAASSASNASASATSASASATTATNKATEASNSATAASNSATTATTKASQAAGSATTAGTSASTATTKASEASASATTATTKAGEAASSASAASGSATTATTKADEADASATSAASSATDSANAASTWTNYYSTYLGMADAPPTADVQGNALQTGAFYYDTGAGSNTVGLYVYNGSTWVYSTNYNNVTAPYSLAQDLATNSHDINFGDNAKATFGTGDDLQIYHDGSHSYISDTGTGNLRIKGTDITLQDASGNGYISMVDGGAGGTVYLKHLGNDVLATTSTGIDVTGGITASGNVGIGTDSPANTLTVGDLEASALDQDATVGIKCNANHKGIILQENSGAEQWAIGVGEAGSLKFYDSGSATPAVTFEDITGNVGIGTDNPDYTLDIESTTAQARIHSTVGNSVLRLESVDDGESKIYFADNSVSAIGTIEYHHDSNYMSFDTVATERMRIDSSGRVGIGTTNPQELLEVASNSSPTVRISNTRSDTNWDTDPVFGALEFYSFDGSGSGQSVRASVKAEATSEFGNSTELVFRNGNSLGVEQENLRIDYLGNVGIGTSSPSYLLSLEQASPTLQLKTTNTSGTNTILFSDSASNFVGNIKYDHSVNSLSFATSSTGSERLRIDSSGNVGIGTTSPSEALTVSGNIQIEDNDGYLQFKDSNAPTNNKIRRIYNAEQNLYISRRNDDGTLESNDVVIDSSGNVGIGTSSPDFSLSVGNDSDSFNYVSIRASDTGSAGYLFSDAQDADVGYVNYSHATNHMGFGANGSEAMRIDASGNLLVGKTSSGSTIEGAELHNSGSIFAVRDSNPAGAFDRKTTDGDVVQFRRDGSTVGSISATASATSYNTSSDERLKENITDSADAGSKVDAIQIRQFDWKADGSHQDYGVIAQELVEVAPEAVHQPVDEEDMMGVDYSKLVPMLIKEVQTLRNRVAQLENN